MRGERLILGLILLALFGALAAHADQPIVENYVGRQIPTAMVARNLDRGSGFLHPMLDTAPFPNLFLVEPPVYAQLVVGMKRAIGFVWEDVGGGWVPSVWEIAGRLTSAVMTVVGAWSFSGLVRRREGPVVALVAVASFGIMPVTLRYGRAFQPDATMLGFVLLGFRAWDQFEADGRTRWAIAGGLALAVGLALKITVGWVLLPYLLLVKRLRPSARLGIGFVMLLPALLWYVHASRELGAAPASGENASTWLQVLGPMSWVRFATWEAITRNLVIRAFTPIGFVLAVAGWVLIRPRSPGDRLWPAWGVGVGLAIVALAAKWHHGYYWIVVAPLVAVGVARLLAALGRSGTPGRAAAVGLGFVLLGLSGYQASSTWRTPLEWEGLAARGDLLPTMFPNWILIAPEAVLFYAERPGFRLEFAPEAVHRASTEWGKPIMLDQANSNPLALIDLYERLADDGLTIGPTALPSQRAAARARRVLVIDLGPVADDPRRAAWREALRRRPGIRVWADRPTLFTAELISVSCSTSFDPQAPR